MRALACLPSRSQNPDPFVSANSLLFRDTYTIDKAKVTFFTDISVSSDLEKLQKMLPDP